MDDARKKEIIDYVTMGKTPMIVGAVFLAASPIAYLVADGLYKYVVPFSVLLMSFILVGIYLYQTISANKVISNIGETGFESLYRDFKYGQRFYGERIICGDTYVFGKGGAIVPLADIQNVFVATMKYKGLVETANVIRVKNKNGKVQTLANLTPECDTDIVVSFIEQRVGGSSYV